MKILINCILILFSLIINVDKFYGQTNIKGFVKNKNGDGISAMIEDLKGGEFFICNDSGYFNITLPEKSSVIEFSANFYLPVRVDIDTIDANDLRIKMVYDSRSSCKEIIMIAPDPPFIEIGYFGRLNNNPFGIHTSIGGWGSKHNLSFDYATKDLNSNNYLNLSYFPGIIDFKKNRKFNTLIKPYLTGTYSKFDTLVILRALICNSSWIVNFISINYGVGLTHSNSSKAIYNIGLTKRFHLPSINPYVPLFYQSYLKLDFFANNETLDWVGKLYFEFYNSSYRRLSFAVGYESIYGYQDFVLNINFKNYIFSRPG